ncbi:Uma2 family endonuclease [Spirosoma endbachense]|uniref:Uma2 family endonuclease n=1 Tax=Spirosoma endbachense TaxID=2666025 RepID=A0A6P1VP57_9BACT|nr:Uma2 family endonuclease [Spirosoma endbachense]QHV94495.1 Uma2 family endonuclease [Spirosoma endbachense]
MPNLIHGAIQANLVSELKMRYRHEYRIASETSLATQPDSTTPDVVVYPVIPLNYQNEPARRTDPPLLCIEIQAPSQSNEEMINKTHIYFQFGVKSCWIVLPGLRAVMIFDRPGHYVFFYEDATLSDPNIGFEFPLTAICA